jgi:P4 family phage/plasmid primase-like protien
MIEISSIPSSLPQDDIHSGAMTDAVLSERFAREVLEGYYCWASGLGWMQWDSKRWLPVGVATVREECRLWVMRKTQEAGAAVSSGDSITDNLNRANSWWKIQAKSRIEAITELAKGIIQVSSGRFDADPDLLNAANGVVDLRTGKLMPHDPEYRMTKLASVGYIPGAKHRDWNTALEALPEEVRSWYLSRLGQAITGYPTPDDLMLVQQGVGANGKSTVMAAVQAAIGDYFHVVSHRALLADASTHPTELMDFRGARVSVLEETPEEGRLSVTRLKMLVGTPQITARRIHKDAVTFDVSHSLFINTNYRPMVEQVDSGTWRRLALVVFPYRFVRPGKETGRDDRPGDPQLRDRLRSGQEQKEAVLASLISAAVEWYANDRIVTALPERVERDTLAWRMESDLILSYADERLYSDPDKHITAKDLLADFNEWLEGKNMYAWGEKKLIQRFGDHEHIRSNGIEKKFTRSKPGLSQSPNSDSSPTASYHAWFGVAFKDESGPRVNRLEGRM